MIAGMNDTPDLCKMGGGRPYRRVCALYEGGLIRGEVWSADLTFASRDPVALDAAGVAALGMHGTRNEREERGVFGRIR